MGALLLTSEEVGADATGDVGDEVCDVRAVVGSGRCVLPGSIGWQYPWRLHAASIRADIDCWQAELRSNERSPSAGDQRGDRG